jgi:hypothetical protein
VSCPYQVSYGFSGFASPVDNAPNLNLANAGKAVPFKFRVTDYNGAAVTNLSRSV